jgi:hypothetical protein
MGCVLHYKDQEFKTKEELANFMLQEKNEAEELHPEDKLELDKTAARSRYDNVFRKWYEAVGLNSESNVKLQEFQASQDQYDSLDKETNMQKSIKKMEALFNAKIILDKSINTLGELLPANNSLALQYKKPVILINPNLARSETVFHEFAHLYVDLLGGSKNDSVKSAMALLQDTEMHRDTALRYPELSGEMLNREVLAQAMGMQADDIFGKELIPMSAFSKLITKIFEHISRILGIKPNAVRQLAKELITKDLQQTPINAYNTLISQKQKISVGEVNFANVTSFLDNFVLKNEGYSSDEVKAETKLTRTSVSKLLKSHIHTTNARYNGKKGDVNLKFKKEDYTQENIELMLMANKIPQALDKSLSKFFKDEGLVDNKVNLTWDKVIDNENSYSRNKKLEAARQHRNSLIGNLDEEEGEVTVSHAIDFVIKNLDEILKFAEYEQSRLDRFSIAGDIVHESVEAYIQAGDFGNDVTDADGKFTGYIRNLITSGKANGSKFYTEIAIYDELNNISARIDLLEIQKDGKFVIHDYKTKDSFINKYSESKETLSDEKLFFNSGHVSQLMIYGKMLENYGMEPAEMPFNLIATKTSYSKLDGIEERDVTVEGLRTFRFNKSSRGNTGIKSALFEKDQKIERVLRKRQLLLKNEAKEDFGYAKIIDKVAKDMIIYNNLARKNKDNFNDLELRNIAAFLKEIKENEKHSDELKLRMSVDSLIEGVANQLRVLESSVFEHEASDIEKNFIYSYKYIIQAMDNLRLLKNAMEKDKENVIGFNNREDKLHDINALLENIETSKRYYKEQVENHAAYQMANNSNFQAGKFKERFDIRLKKEGVVNEIEREKQVEELLKANKDEIFGLEFEYWKDQYREGILDLRGWEYYMADPGISKSQFVQVTKNLIDKAGMNTRLEIDKIMPEISRWNENISYNKTGSTREIWKDILEKRKVKGLDGELIEDLNGSIIPEFTSDYREQMFEYITQKEHYLDIIRELKSVKNLKPAEAIKLTKAEKLLEELFKERKLQNKRNEEIKGLRTLRANPAFESLSEEKKENARFIHKNLRDADARVQNSKLKLTSYFSTEDVTEEDRESGKGEYIYNLPRQRMIGAEAANSLSKTVANFTSRIKDIVRAPFDRDEMTYEESVNRDEEGNIIEREDSLDSFNSSMSDIENNEVYDVPVYFRNSLGKDRAIQSFDIPSLLAENHAATITYAENKMIEADVFMISESLRMQGDILKTDGMFSGKVLGAFNRPRKSDNNYVFKAVQNQIENRLYGRHYSGIYTKGTYTAAHTVSTLKAITSISTLTGNFMSALNTSGSGSVYRFLEGIAGEHFNKKDWANGSKKTYGDLSNVLADTQRAFPQSKTILLIRMLGMDHQYKALANKFVKKSFASKNLDEGTLFALTTIAETNITAHLMYSLTGGIKMMNKKGEYINKDGVVVSSKEQAMSFDEAYEVVDGVLKLNKHVGYTSKDFANKFNEDGDVNRVALTNISGYVKSVYADLFGQYDHNMKSVFETSVLGAATMSMKKWLPRGLNRRFRGIGTQLAWGKNLMDFDKLHNDENEHNRFYSQDQQGFQEGYFVTAARYVRLLGYELRKTGSVMSVIEKNKDLKLSMSKHELANLNRAATDSIYMIAMYAAKTLLLALAESIGSDPRDRAKKERAYFAAYLALKLYHESASFVNPFALAKTVTDPSVPSGQLFKIAGLADQLFMFSYDKDSDIYFSPNITEEFKTGRKKGQSKAIDKIKSVAIPGYGNFSRAMGILGAQDDPDFLISDSFKFYMKNN